MNLTENDFNKESTGFYVPRSRMIGIGSLFFIALTLLSWAIAYFTHRSAVSILNFSQEVHVQILIGILYGSVAALIIIFLLNRNIFNEVKLFFNQVIQGFQLRITDIIVISLCAGFTEELFFRAMIQPYLGIWITSVIFIALHGYLNIFNWKVCFFGLSMILVSSGLGYLFEMYGLLCASLAHAVYDMAILYYIVIYSQQNFRES